MPAKVSPDLQKFIDTVLAQSARSAEEQVTHPDGSAIIAQLQRFVDVGDRLLNSFSLHPENQATPVRENAIYMVMASAANQILGSQALMFVDIQDIAAVASVIVGALITNGTLVEASDTDLSVRS